MSMQRKIMLRNLDKENVENFVQEDSDLKNGNGDGASRRSLRRKSKQHTTTYTLENHNHNNNQNMSTRRGIGQQKRSVTNAAQFDNDDNAVSAQATALQLLNLKPLRDLEQNFDIDIASYLNDYLNEIEHEGFNVLSSSQNNSINDSNIPPNFAQAALLLQNSSGVYSRKVEYLHSLVFQTLKSLIEQSSSSLKKNKSATRSKTKKQHRGVDEDITNFEEYDPDLRFLLLDDVLPIDTNGNKINLNNEHYDNNMMMMMNSGQNVGVLNSRRQSLMSNISLNVSSIGTNGTKLSIGTGGGGGLEDNQNDSTMTSYATIGHSASNATLQLMNGACNIHSGTGALLMPGTTTKDIPMFQSNIQQNDNGMANCGTATSNDNDIIQHEQMDVSMEHHQDVTMGDVQSNVNEDDHDFNNGGGDYDDHDDNDGIGFVLNDDGNAHEQCSAGNVEGIENSNNEQTELEIQDPWEMMLDPHDNSKSKVRPLRAGKTLRIPPELDGELPSDLVTGSRTKSNCKKRKNKSDGQRLRAKNKEEDYDESDVWWKRTCLASQTYKEVITLAKKKFIKRQSHYTLNSDDDEDTIHDSDDENDSIKSLPMTFVPFKGHLFGNEFEYIAQYNRRRKAAEIRKNNRFETNETSEIAINSVAAAITQERFRDMYGDEDGIDDDRSEGPMDFGSGSAEYDDGEDDDYDIGGNFHDDTDNVNQEAQGDGALNDFDEVFQANHDNGENSNSSDHATFEELCRAHLKEFAKGAEKYAVETQLAKRVSKWQSKLEGVLSEEEKRPDFNIQTYSSNIIREIHNESLQNTAKSDDVNEGNVIKFASLTKSLDTYQVSRTFLASLSLCNSENIIFCDKGEAEEVALPESLELKLMKLEINSPMEHYLAPSMVVEKEI